ncbi:MAG: RagB/SusD family nutrient uptake outer membrane protein, partial [Bacteroidota bacterium]
NQELARDRLNEVRNRAGLSSLENITLQDILDERFLEFTFEGHRFRDIKRLQLNFTNNIRFNDPIMIFPIPQREMDVNNLLVQNEYYR